MERPLRLDYEAFRGLPTTELVTDIHCVTRWSKLGQRWEGVSMRHVLDLVQPKPEAKFVIAHSEHGFTANLPLEALMDDDVLLAHRADGEDLTAEHGWPLRLFVPQRYFWKSAKWLRGLELTAEDRPGILGAERVQQQRRSLEGRAVLVAGDVHSRGHVAHLRLPGPDVRRPRLERLRRAPGVLDRARNLGASAGAHRRGGGGPGSAGGGGLVLGAPDALGRSPAAGARRRSRPPAQERVRAGDGDVPKDWHTYNAEIARSKRWAFYRRTRQFERLAEMEAEAGPPPGATPKK